jgi:hypothetical protein
MVGVWFDESGHTIVVVSYQAITYDLPTMSGFLSKPNATNGLSGEKKDFKRWGPAPEKPSK